MSNKTDKSFIDLLNNDGNDDIKEEDTDNIMDDGIKRTGYKQEAYERGKEMMQIMNDDKSNMDKAIENNTITAQINDLEQQIATLTDMYNEEGGHTQKSFAIHHIVQNLRQNLRILRSLKQVEDEGITPEMMDYLSKLAVDFDIYVENDDNNNNDNNIRRRRGGFPGMSTQIAIAPYIKSTLASILNNINRVNRRREEE